MIHYSRYTSEQLLAVADFCDAAAVFHEERVPYARSQGSAEGAVINQSHADQYRACAKEARRVAAKKAP